MEIKKDILKKVMEAEAVQREKADRYNELADFITRCVDVGICPFCGDEKFIYKKYTVTIQGQESCFGMCSNCATQIKYYDYVAGKNPGYYIDGKHLMDY